MFDIINFDDDRDTFKVFKAPFDANFVNIYIYVFFI